LTGCLLFGNKRQPIFLHHLQDSDTRLTGALLNSAIGLQVLSKRVLDGKLEYSFALAAIVGHNPAMAIEVPSYEEACAAWRKFLTESDNQRVMGSQGSALSEDN